MFESRHSDKEKERVSALFLFQKSALFLVDFLVMSPWGRG